MRMVPECLSVLQSPRCRIQTLANFWNESLISWKRSYSYTSRPKRCSSRIYVLEGRHSEKWTRRPVSTKTEGRSKTTRSKKLSGFRNGLFDGTLSTSVTLNINETETSKIQKAQCCDIQRKIVEDKDLAKLVTVIVFDVETTGFSRENERIIEIALRDLLGGENSTFQTLVNPERYVSNSHVHGITTNMVNKPDVPRMRDLIPILLQFVKSRQKPEGYVILIAHNARCFDVPFLIKEFNRCSVEIPENWLFMDTLKLVREMKKAGGSELLSVKLEGLRKYFKIPLNGSAHRAMSDVNSLSLILQRLTFDLKLDMSSLVERSFTPLDLNIKRRKARVSHAFAS